MTKYKVLAMEFKFCTEEFEMGHLKMLGILAFCLTVAAAPLGARAACDHPGTPSSMKLVPSANYVTIWFINGASEGDHTDLYFDVESTEPPPSGTVSFDPIPRITTSVKFGKIAFHGQGTIAVNGLDNLKQYCFRLWVRDDSFTGCRSEQPTAPVCVTTLAPGVGGSSNPPVLANGVIVPYRAWQYDPHPVQKNGF
jgi:hypothetical protein